MLNIEFRRDAELIDDEIIFEEPYTQLSVFFADDVQRSFTSADRLAAELRGIIAGTEPPLVDATGNAWTMDIDANVAHLACYFATPHQFVEVPTAWLVDALERWRDHLIAKKKRLSAAGSDPI
jgi:hypothetical protein